MFCCMRVTQLNYSIQLIKVQKRLCHLMRLGELDSATLAADIMSLFDDSSKRNGDRGR